MTVYLTRDQSIVSFLSSWRLSRLLRLRRLQQIEQIAFLTCLEATVHISVGLFTMHFLGHQARCTRKVRFGFHSSVNFVSNIPWPYLCFCLQDLQDIFGLQFLKFCVSVLCRVLLDSRGHRAATSGWACRMSKACRIGPGKGFGRLRNGLDRVRK